MFRTFLLSFPELPPALSHRLFLAGCQCSISSLTFFASSGYSFSNRASIPSRAASLIEYRGIVLFNYHIDAAMSGDHTPIIFRLLSVFWMASLSSLMFMPSSLKVSSLNVSLLNVSLLKPLSFLVLISPKTESIKSPGIRISPLRQVGCMLGRRVTRDQSDLWACHRREPRQA